MCKKHKKKQFMCRQGTINKPEKLMFPFVFPFCFETVNTYKIPYLQEIWLYN